MKIEQLLNPDLNLDLQGCFLHLPQNSTSGTLALGHIDVEHDAVYFGPGSSNSFSGHLSAGLEDKEVIEYIRRNNQVLYDRLWGSRQSHGVEPVTSAITDHRDESDGAARSPQRNGLTSERDRKMANAAGGPDNSRASRSTSNALRRSPSSTTSVESCGGDILSAMSSKEPTSSLPSPASRSKNELQQDLCLLQQRRYIQSLLLNDHVLVLQKVPPLEAKARSRSCDHPLCSYRHGMPPGIYRLSLESKKALAKPTATTDKYYSPKDQDSAKYLKVRSTNSRGFYCLTCVEDLFNGVGMLDDDYTSSSSTPRVHLFPASPTSALVSVDGSSDNLEVRAIILVAAEKLLPCARLANESRIRINAQVAKDIPRQRVSDPPAAISTEHDLEGVVADQIPSNSDNEILLRDAKRQETRATLHLLDQVAYRQEARRLSQSFSDEELPSLKILRPIGLPAPEERYKKQGLGTRDWRLWRSSLPAPYLRKDTAATININMNGGDDQGRSAPVGRFCYCGEPDDFEGMVSCGAEFCLTGQVHLRCSGLPRLPVKDETWFCNECSTLFGSGKFDPSLAPSPEHGVERSRVLRSTARATARFVNRNEPRNGTSEELSADETSLPFSDDETLDPTYTLPMTPRRQSRSAVGMTFTPYQFLDGPDDGKSHVPSSVSAVETVKCSPNVRATPTSIKDKPKGARSSVRGTKRASTLTLQDAAEAKTPTKRLKRTSSPPPPLTPPSRHLQTRFGHLAKFVYAESRTSAAALSNPQAVALEKWKSVHLYSPLTEVMDSSKPQSVASPSACKNEQQASAVGTIAPNIATLELGGTAIDIPSVHGKTLNQILSEVDTMVETELRKQGSTGWEQGVHAREEAVKIGKARGSQVDDQNGLTSPKAANEVRRRISRGFSGRKEAS